jgi:hypothetical protein
VSSYITPRAALLEPRMLGCPMTCTDSPCSAGITVGLIDDIPTCQELVQRMGMEAEGIIKSLVAKVVPDSGEQVWADEKRESKL